MEINDIDIMMNAFVEFEQFTNERGINFFVVVSPFLEEVLAKKCHLDPLIEKLRNETDIEVIDLCSYFIDDKNLNDTNIFDYYWRMEKI